MIFLISNLSCNDNPVDSTNANEDYVFLDMFILTYLSVIEGHCDITIRAVEPGTFYRYESSTKSLSYRTSNSFPINDDLKIVTGFSHWYAPLAGVFDAEFLVVPSYSFPDQITDFTIITSVDSLGTIVEMSAGFSSKAHPPIRVPTTINLPADSTFQMVFKTIQGGMTVFGGDSCVLEYTDSLVIRNYGLNPKSNILYFSGAGAIPPALNKTIGE